MINEPIPIVLLHNNEFDFLRRTVESINRNTDYPHELIVIDNNSTSNTAYWANLESEFGPLSVIYNRRNNWIYGFNLAKEAFGGKYVVLSDADIVVPQRFNGVCWLTHLINEMDHYPFIGKLGLSLDLSKISKIESLNNLYLKEKQYKSGVVIGRNIVSPIDSTMAIYRTNLFITPFKMRIGHMRLMRPYLYCARTAEEYKCEHIGWEKYIDMVNDPIASAVSIEMIVKKARFFSLFGILLPRDLIKKLPHFNRMQYWLVFLFIRIIHGIKLYLYWWLYFLRHKPGSLNKIQEKARWKITKE